MGLGLRGRVAASPVLRRLLTRANLLAAHLGRGAVLHPLDHAYGVETQAHLPAYLSRTGSEADAHLIPYAGCVASALRRVLTTLPPVDGWTFLDLGCGKGRALIVGSEAPFGALIGVELLPDLVRVARRNARRVLRAHPERAPITVLQGDASRPPWPQGPVVAFLYHPFDAELVEVLKAHMLAHAQEDVFVIYENPVHGRVFDEDARFHRWFSAMLDYDPDEIGLGFDVSESMVAWRYAPGGGGAARPGADLVIDPVLPGLRAVLA